MIQSSITGGPRRRTAWAFAAGACIAVTVLVVGSLSGRDREAGREGAPKPRRSVDAIALGPEQLASINVRPVEYREVPISATVPGRIEFNADLVAPLFAQFSGHVVRLDVEVGSVVRQGQIVGMLDSPDVVSMQADLHEGLAAERGARTSLDQAVRTRERASRLVDVEAIPLRELQEAQTAEAHAIDELRRAEAAVAAARGRLQIAGFGQDEIERLETGGAAAITRLVPLRAPVSGTVVERHVGLGQVVQPGSDPLFRIADLSVVWLMADVYEDQLASIHDSESVTIQTPAYPSDTFTARVNRIGATVDPEKRTIAVRCVIDNHDRRLKPGMFATVNLESGQIARALVVPPAAIVASGDRRSVFVEVQRGEFRERTVVPGPELADAVIVRSGVTEGDRVVTRGGLLLARQLDEVRSGQ